MLHHSLILALFPLSYGMGEFHDQGHNVKKENYQLKTSKYALRAANPRAADRPAAGWPPEGHIVMTL
jgi:hypothetical protein